MTQGMWTKHYTAEGLVYFYNASLNQSVWHPPDNGIIHIAPYLEYQSDHTSTSQYTHIGHDTAGLPISVLPDSNDNNVMSQSGDTDVLARDGLSNSHTTENSTARPKGNTAKRFKSNQSNEESSAQNTFESSYLRQKAELEAMMGCKKDDSSKWLVR